MRIRELLRFARLGWRALEHEARRLGVTRRAIFNVWSMGLFPIQE